ncbi:MAG TPA: DNA polymerase III subunit alpha [Bacteroidales bacterium]|nr:DNA polymerase III subunit alpha [Bacteroidales bacterium]HPI86522.1 DNA polymerase III subunit alpha [Bacteroidales bacterium]HPM92429.1 DNA polymerase III subunit alpha [Bacteroidales bacterium]
MFLIFDTETTGLPRNYEAPVTDVDNWPRAVQLAWQLHDTDGSLVEARDFIIKPDNFTIPYNAAKVHGITTEFAAENGDDLKLVLEQFIDALQQATVIVGHNVDFDMKIIGAEFVRTRFENYFEGKIKVDTDRESLNYCALPGGIGGGFKLPKLGELHQKLFGDGFAEAHNAAADVRATARCFLELIRLGIITAGKLGVDPEVVRNFIINHPEPVQPEQITLRDLRQTVVSVQQPEETSLPKSPEPGTLQPAITPFCHLHVHSQYSILQATADVKDIIAKAVEMKMPAMALTDHGNLYGAFAFIGEAVKHKIKPIIGCEYYISLERTRKKFTKDNPDVRYHQVLLAKNLTGYQNLSRLSSIGFLEGFYDGVPRIDKPLIEKYREGLIATTGGLKSEINDLILNIGETQAEEAFCYWLRLFGDDFYVQLNRHGLPEEEHVNKVLLQLARKYNVRYFAANNAYYLAKDDAEIHDMLLCLQLNEYQATPVGHGRGYRFGFPNNEFYLKSREEMEELFHDLPEAIATAGEIADKIETYPLKRNPLMPDYEIPSGFDDANAYLRHVTYQGAEKRYGSITPEIAERIDFELETIKRMGYPGYFLIVQEILHQAREMGVSVGPGRGSAAGSVVAYCLRITDVDPIRYNLLFERFLNPDRISLPDIDIDFDEDGREKVLKWVVEKYGAGRVAQVITFGKMAPKGAIRDIARVKQLPLSESDRLAKLVNMRPGTTFTDAYKESPDLQRERKEGEPLVQETLKGAERIEGQIRNTGTHACGIIIGKNELIDLIPLSITKESDMLATQFDGSQIESVGMLKMDFLGLKTLSIIKDTLDNIRKSKGLSLDIEAIPLTDTKTFELYSKGDTNGIFQFESEGMKKHLRDLKPNRFEDLIAMNALYRPGPMDYIPNFINRKHGREKIEYPLPEMEEILKETYGITVYQEQVMLLSQRLAGFTKGRADVLRKGMGKKNKDLIDELKKDFIEGIKSNDLDEEIAAKIWTDWEKFAGYAFNKSHSTCYAVVSYRMAWLKAHYPAEFMAAVLSRHLSEIKKITFFIDECKHLHIPVLGPDVNESELHFVVNKKGGIRFGMAAIKGVGESAVNAIIEERNANGPFRSIFDFVKRINLRAVNKRALEALAKAGAFDGFQGIHRAQYFQQENPEDNIFLEKIIRHAAIYQEKQQASQHSLFGDDLTLDLQDPKIPDCPQWSKHHQLKYEREVTGFFISGHPLDEYKAEIDSFCNVTFQDLNAGLSRYLNKAVSFAGMINTVEIRTAKTGNQYANFELEDFTDSYRLSLFSDDFMKFKYLLVEDTYVLIFGKVEVNRKNNRPEIRIKNMILLAEAMERFCKSVSVTFELDRIDSDLVRSVVKIVKSNPGECEIKIRIKDQDGFYLDMFPKKFRVSPAGFIHAISEFEQVNYSVNGFHAVIGN